MFVLFRINKIFTNVRYFSPHVNIQLSSTPISHPTVILSFWQMLSCTTEHKSYRESRESPSWYRELRSTMALLRTTVVGTDGTGVYWEELWVFKYNYMLSFYQHPHIFHLPVIMLSHTSLLYIHHSTKFHSIEIIYYIVSTFYFIVIQH